MRWFCSFKAYGDLVIACNFLRMTDPSLNGLLAGSHLRPLIQAIGFDGTQQIIEVGSNVPAFFDVNKCGYVSAIREGFSLRSQIHKSVYRRENDCLVFDSLGIRQRFLGWPFPLEAVARGTGNIYLDYANYLGIDCDSSMVTAKGLDQLFERVCIFPDSRITAKELPESLIAAVVRENNKLGKETVLVKIGEPTALPPLGSLKVLWINGFNQLVDQVRSSDLVVSADSLPAHLAEYFGVPNFVFLSKSNDYWMPLSCYRNGFFSEFNSLAGYAELLGSCGLSGAK